MRSSLLRARDGRRSTADARAIVHLDIAKTHSDASRGARRASREVHNEVRGPAPRRRALADARRARKPRSWVEAHGLAASMRAARVRS
jgi:hypothetical protein